MSSEFYSCVYTTHQHIGLGCWGRPRNQGYRSTQSCPLCWCRPADKTTCHPAHTRPSLKPQAVDEELVNINLSQQLICMHTCTFVSIICVASGTWSTFSTFTWSRDIDTLHASQTRKLQTTIYIPLAVAAVPGCVGDHMRVTWCLT